MCPPSKWLEVVAAAGASTVQDQGRPGAGALGLSRSGAIDPASLRRANRLVGNAGNEAAIEIGPFGISVRAHGALLMAVCGAGRTMRVAGGTAAPEAPVLLAAGDTMTVGHAVGGVYSYLAVAGGLDVPMALGSAATDTMSGIGPAPLAAGDVLTVRAGTPGPVTVDLAVVPPHPDVVRCTPGPREDRFTRASIDRFYGEQWVVGPQTSRIGARLDGDPLERAQPGDVEPEPMLPGYVQLPPDGRPVVLLRDHGVTGGYPVIACVHPDDVWIVGQTPPGATVRFRRDGTFVPHRSTIVFDPAGGDPPVA
jgi:biotin-dependent carboxylase-like uncharacterized protein